MLFSILIIKHSSLSFSLVPTSTNIITNIMKTFNVFLAGALGFATWVAGHGYMIEPDSRSVFGVGVSNSLCPAIPQHYQLRTSMNKIKYRTSSNFRNYRPALIAAPSATSSSPSPLGQILPLHSLAGVDLAATMPVSTLITILPGMVYGERTLS